MVYLHDIQSSALLAKDIMPVISVAEEPESYGKRRETPQRRQS